MRICAVLLAAALSIGCAARIPPAATFSPGAWSAVTSITPGSRVEVRYVTGDPPLRHTFEGTFRSATATHLEMDTEAGRQRLLATRVLRVGIGGRESRILPATFLMAVLGGLIGGAMSAIQEDNDDTVSLKTAMGAGMGGAIGLLLGTRRGEARPRVIYERRRGSL